MTSSHRDYPLVLRPVMAHADRLAELLAEREKRSPAARTSDPWLIGRADELRCLSAALADDCAEGRLSAGQAAIGIARYVHALHAGLASVVGPEVLACCVELLEAPRDARTVDLEVGRRRGPS